MNDVDILVTAPLPVAPLMLVGPVAVNVHAVAGCVPPLSLVTVLTSVSRAAWSLLLIVQVATSPIASAMLFPATAAPPFLMQL